MSGERIFVAEENKKAGDFQSQKNQSKSREPGFSAALARLYSGKKWFCSFFQRELIFLDTVNMERPIFPAWFQLGIWTSGLSVIADKKGG
jgi:hypothetical protein